MILQGVYTFISNDNRLAYFKDEHGQTASIQVKYWTEMGSPELVSVTVMRLMTRTNS